VAAAVGGGFPGRLPRRSPISPTAARRLDRARSALPRSARRGPAGSDVGPDRPRDHGKRRRRWTLDLAFGKDGINAGRARATVQIDGTTYDGLRTRTMAPMQALLGGKVKIDGDRTLAMKALMLTAQRLGRAT
jgi:hypothetical protein